MNLLNVCLEGLYPTTCCFCGKVNRNGICRECSNKIKYVKEPRCKKCGKPVRYQETEVCHDCKETVHEYEQGRSVWLHKGPVRHSIYQFKYHNRRVYAKVYAKEWYRLYSGLLKEWQVDVLIPVPLHRKRQRKRGYNQAEILAKELGKLTNIPVDTKSVIRVHNTMPQKELSHLERKKNVKDAFDVISWRVKGRHVLLVDDIYTTGNTIDAVAKVLKEKADCKVFFFTISIGQGF